MQHLSSLQISALLKTGRLHQGTLAISSHNYLAGSIFADISDEAEQANTSILISGREHINRALHGDVVAVELLPRDQWKRVADDKVLDQESENAQDDADEGGDEDMTEQETEGATRDAMDIDESCLRPTGRVVGVIKRNWRPFCVRTRSNPIPCIAGHD